MNCEVIIVDNDSHDDTSAVCQAVAATSRTPVRYIAEPRRGQARARNSGISASRGDIILFTDDDVHPPAEWLDAMCRPIATGAAHAVAGGVRIALGLERDWMGPLHRAWLAENTGPPASAGGFEMVGANMAFSREVLERVPEFDPNLGPGALGFGDDAHFSRALKAAGYRLAFVPTYVEHHFEESRLTRESFIAAAIGRGRSAAYLAHHWEHRAISFPRLRLAKHRANLNFERRRRGGVPEREGMQSWEMHALWSVSFFQQFLVERVKPRRYPRGSANSQGKTELST